MKGPVALPFLSASAQRCSVIWTVHPEPQLGETLPDWSPATPVAVSVLVNIDLAGLREDCGLPLGSRIDAVLTWASAGTSVRGSLCRKPLSRIAPASEEVLDGEVPGGLAGTTLVFTVSIIYAGTGIRAGSQSALAATRAGSVLWQARRKIILEGTAARFPIHVAHFAASDLPANAPWFLDWAPSTPADPLLGAVRLYLNVDHPAMAAMLAVTPDNAPVQQQGALVEQLLQHDIASQLVTGSLRADEFVEASEGSFAEGTVGAHVQGLISSLFPGESVAALRTLLAERPGDFASRLQNRLPMIPKDFA